MPGGRARAFLIAGVILSAGSMTCNGAPEPEFPSTPELSLPDPCEDEIPVMTWPEDSCLSLASTLAGEAPHDRAGSVMAGVGDVNGDGYDDLLIGVSNEGAAGAAYLIYGPAPGTLVLADADVTLVGEGEGDRAGYAVAGGGDINGDGFDDFVIGADLEDTAGGGAGAVYVVYGPPPNGVLSLADAGAKLTGEYWGNGAGAAVAVAGDINADGYADLLVGAPRKDRGDGFYYSAGTAYLLYGPLWGLQSLSEADAIFARDSAADNTGASVSAAGDMNGDGYDDLLIAAPQMDQYGLNRGRVYLFHGPVQGSVDLSTADAQLYGEANEDYAGWSISGGGDLNGDVVPDIVVGAPGNDKGGEHAGAVYIVYGPIAGEHSLADADVEIIGDPDQRAGRRVAIVGDINGDGLDDLLVSSGIEPGCYRRSHLFFGPASAARFSDADWVLVGPGDSSGDYGISGAGDINGDGVADMTVGMPKDAGAIYLFHGCSP